MSEETKEKSSEKRSMSDICSEMQSLCDEMKSMLPKEEVKTEDFSDDEMPMD